MTRCSFRQHQASIVISDVLHTTLVSLPTLGHIIQCLSIRSRMVSHANVRDGDLAVTMARKPYRINVAR